MKFKEQKIERKHTRLPTRDPRFQQLLSLAREGEATAIHDLWAEFQFDFKWDGGGLE